MTPQNGLIVEYTIDDSEWQRTSDARYDSDTYPTADYFYGRLQLRTGEEVLFAPDAFLISIADVACGFARLLARGFPGPDASTRERFKQTDDALVIEFERGGDAIKITTNGPTRALVVGVEAASHGIHEFVARFAREAGQRVPRVFEWDDLEILAPFERQ